MKDKKKQTLAMAFLAVLITVLVSTNSYSLIYVNGSGGGYEGGGGTTDTIAGDSSEIESYIILAAGHYLEGKGHVDRLLSLVESKDMNGPDYPGLSLTVDNALANIQAAAGLYEKLIALAEKTPYNMAVSQQLLAFDYEGFCREQGLNIGMMTVVESYLGKGDITGLYKRLYKSMKNIEILLQGIKKAVSANTLPALPDLWKVNEGCCEISLLGSYVARIFDKINTLD